MLESIDLRKLAELEAPERAFVSLYLSGPEAMGSLSDREDRVRRLLADDPVETEHFVESMRLLRETLEESGGPEGPMALFASWALDFVAGYALPAVPKDLLWVDSSPYIRPLAELQEEYESFVVVFADNEAAEVYVASGPEELLKAGSKIRGDVKNHVKKGGWSQKRYQRRRSNELLHYAKEVAERIERVVAEAEIEKLVLVGSQEALRAIEEALPESLAGLVAGSIVEDLGKETQELLVEAVQATHERQTEEKDDLWAWLRNEGLKEGLAAFGPSDVLAAALEGRVDVLLVQREAEVRAMRCRDCELLAYAKPQQCPRCRSTSVFGVDLLNELVELAAKTGASTRFVEDNETLAELGDVAAALRWHSEPTAAA